MNIWNIEKMKIMGTILELPANPAHLLQKWAKLAKSTLLISWYQKNASRILIVSIAMGADCLMLARFVSDPYKVA